MVREFSQIDYLVQGINNADGINECIEVITSTREKVRKAQLQSKQNGNKENDKAVPENLVSSIQASMNRNVIRNTKNMADALENAVKGRIAEAKEQGKEINNIVIDDNGIKAGNSKDGGEER